MEYSSNQRLAAGQELTRQGYGTWDQLMLAIGAKSELSKAEQNRLARLALLAYPDRKTDVVRRYRES